MKFVELKKNLENTLSQIYFLQGEDRELVSKATKMIVDKVLPNNQELDLQTYDDENFSMQNIIENAQTFPFCNEHRLILIKHSLEKLTEQDSKLFDYYLQSKPQQTIILWIFQEKTTFFQKYLTKVEFVDCSKLDNNILTKYTASALAKSNKKISLDACNLLVEYCDFDMAKIDMEISKLCSVCENELINVDDIKNNVSKSLDYEIFELNEAIMQNNLSKALSITNYLLSKKISSQYILGVLNSFQRRIFWTSITNGSDAEIAKWLGVKEYAIKKTRPDCLKFSKLKLKKNVETCLNNDFCIKNGKKSDINAIFSQIFTLLQK